MTQSSPALNNSRKLGLSNKTKLKVCLPSSDVGILTLGFEENDLKYQLCSVFVVWRAFIICSP